jgi:hypothetical protein
VARGGNAGQAGAGGNAVGGNGGNGLGDPVPVTGGAGGDAVGGAGGIGSAGGDGNGGGLFNAGNVSMTGVTVHFLGNQAFGGNGGGGGSGGNAAGGRGGAPDGRDGTGPGGAGGNGGASGNASGGGIFHRAGSITIRPRLGARPRAAQSRAINLVTANRAGIGGGAVFLARAVVQDTRITGNFASVRDNDVNGKFTR